MGQKVHPTGFRVGINRPWQSNWYAERDYGQKLCEDIRLRRFLKAKLYHAGISKIVIERAGQQVRVNIHAARPGVIIGKKGAGVDKVKAEAQKFSKSEVVINIYEVRKLETDGQLVAENVALQLERRVAYRRAMKRAMSQALKFGAQGVKVCLAGRIGGAEIARREWYCHGSVPLHTLKADIDYGQAEALTTYGKIGVKVWIYKGNIGTSLR